MTESSRESGPARIEEARLAFEAGDYARCIHVASRLLETSVDREVSFWLRMTLAAALQLAEGSTETDLRRARAITYELLDETTPCDDAWPILHRRLGFLWMHIDDVDAASKARTHFELALQSNTIDPEMRATILVQLAYAIIREGHDGFRELGQSCFDRALQVFTASEYPEEFREIAEAQSALAQSGRTPTDRQLVNAVTHGWAVRVRDLIESGHSANGRSSEGATLLQIALAEGHSLIARILVLAGADQAARDPKGFGALHWAVFGERAELLEIANSNRGGVDPQDGTGRTPLTWAAAHGWTAGVHWLLDHGADPNRGDLDGWTALHYAAANNRGEVASVLLARGADRNAAGKSGETAFDVAVGLGHRETAELLLAGAP